ncbi:Unknown protein [Striga hermonthica]|uniref:Uncharacterized protein n=1 Tax=Striga hermonthica TaxID=68872 RepID=A0A9N7RTB8_STRHE|nr:Unknown protein [Striga hermonthica]
MPVSHNTPIVCLHLPCLYRQPPPKSPLDTQELKGFQKQLSVSGQSFALARAVAASWHDLFAECNIILIVASLAGRHYLGRETIYGELTSLCRVFENVVVVESGRKLGRRTPFPLPTSSSHCNLKNRISVTRAGRRRCSGDGDEAVVVGGVGWAVDGHVDLDAYASSITGRISRRPDPLRNFRHYGGDYDISSKHYLASTAFTGIHGYAVAGIWLLCGLSLVIFNVVIKSIKRSPSTIVDRSSTSNRILLLLLLIVTSFAIVASGLTIAENQKSLKKARKLEETVRDAGNEASNNIGRVKAAMLRMQTLLQPYNSDICNQLNLTTHRLRKTSLSIQSFIRNNLKTWDQAIQTLYVMNLVVVSIDLVLLVAGLVLLHFQFRPGIIVLIFTCWILTTLGWILTGVDFLFHTFIGDTCLVLKNYEIDPQTNSLGSMLPCPKSTDSVQTLEKINYSIHAFINELNWKIREVIESNEKYEGIPVVEVCDPFSTSTNDSFSLQNCAENSIPIGDLPRVLSTFVCYEADSTSRNCEEEGRFLPESMYTVSLAYTQSMQDFINIYPDLSSLMKCSSIKEAFSEIVTRQCRPIELSTRGLWASMLALSVVMVVLVLLWIYRASHMGYACVGMALSVPHGSVRYLRRGELLTVHFSSPAWRPAFFG